MVRCKKNLVWGEKLTEEDGDVVLTLDEGLKGAGCYVLNLIIMEIIRKITITVIVLEMSLKILHECYCDL